MSSVRALAAGTAAIAVSGMVAASAAWLGGINSKDLGADAALIASCDTDGVVVGPYTSSYVAQASDTGGYELTSFNVSGIAAACESQKINVVLGTNGTGSVPNESYWVSPSLTVWSTGTQSFTIAGGTPTTGILDESVDSVSIVITEP